MLGGGATHATGPTEAGGAVEDTEDRVAPDVSDLHRRAATRAGQLVDHGVELTAAGRATRTDDRRTLEARYAHLQTVRTPGRPRPWPRSPSARSRRRARAPSQTRTRDAPAAPAQRSFPRRRSRRGSRTGAGTGDCTARRRRLTATQSPVSSHALRHRADSSGVRACPARWPVCGLPLAPDVRRCPCRCPPCRADAGAGARTPRLAQRRWAARAVVQLTSSAVARRHRVDLRRAQRAQRPSRARRARQSVLPRACERASCSALLCHTDRRPPTADCQARRARHGRGAPICPRSPAAARPSRSRVSGRASPAASR